MILAKYSDLLHGAIVVFHKQSANNAPKHMQSGYLQLINTVL